MKQSARRWLRQAVKFGLVGALNTLVDFLTFSLLQLIPWFKQYYLAAQGIGYCAGVLNSIYFNKKWTFAQKEPMRASQVIAFLTVNLVTLALSSGVLVLTQEVMGMDRLVGKAVSIVFSLGVNFIGSKLIVFKK